MESNITISLFVGSKFLWIPIFSPQDGSDATSVFLFEASCFFSYNDDKKQLQLGEW